MPETRMERRAREKWQHEQRKEMNKAITQVPNHISHRLNTPSEFSKNMAKWLTPYRFLGLSFSDDGQQQPPSQKRGKAGGQAMKEEADRNCLELKNKLLKTRPGWWGNKKRIRKIAELSGFSEKTIKRYFERHP